MLGRHPFQPVEKLASGAMLIPTRQDGTYPVEARFVDLDGTGELTACEVRIVLHDHDVEDIVRTDEEHAR